MFKLLRRLITTIFVLIFIVCGVIGGIGYMEYKSAIEKEPLVEKVMEIQNSRTYVQYEDISEDFIYGLVSIEDQRFFEHSGVDYIALIRTLWANIQAKDILGGGSTLTQQLAKNLYFMDSTRPTRKIAEVFVAYDLEKTFTKEEILEMYANIVYYGDNYYGIYEASYGYFHCDPSNLSLAQASMLAGLPQAPSLYALSNNNEASYARQEEVLKAMLEHGYIDTDELIEALRSEL